MELNQTTDPAIADGIDELGDFGGDIPLDLGELDLPFTLSLELPGEYIEHNATREVDGVLIWDSNLLEGIDVMVVSRDSGLGIEMGPLIITAIFAMIVLAIVVSVVYSRERCRRRAEEDAALEAQKEQQIGADSSM